MSHGTSTAAAAIRRLFVAALVLALSVSTTATAQVVPTRPVSRHQRVDFRVVHWTTEDGLPQNTINDIVVLPNGELWLATFGGLVRFDGIRFQVIDLAASEELPSNRITALAQAGADSAWFVTQEGHLGRLEAGRAVTLVAPASRLHDMIAVVTDEPGRAFGKANDGSVWRTDGKQPWRQILGRTNETSGLHPFAKTEDGATWAVWGNALVKLGGGAADRLAVLPEPAWVVAPHAGLGLWVGLEHGLGRFRSGRLEPLDIRPPIEGTAVALAPEGEDAVWVGNERGLFLVERQPDASWSRFPVPLGQLPRLGIRSLKLDREGSLWVGTNGGGLYRVSHPPARRFGAESGLGAVTALAPDGDGGAWVASGCQGLFHVDQGGAVTSVRLRGSTLSERLLGEGCQFALAAGAPDGVWVRAEARLYRVRHGPLEVRRVPVDLPQESGPIAPIPDGSLYVMSRSGLLQRVSPSGEVVRRITLPPPLVSAALAPDGALWVGGEGQIFRIVGGTVQRFGQGEGMPRGPVRDLLTDQDGTVWIATYGGGLGRLRDGRVSRITAQQGLPDNALSRLIDDGRGRIWISTNRGLAMAERDDLTAVANGDKPVFHPVLLGSERGVAEANFGSPAGFADDRGWLWFGTIEGVASLDAARFPFNPDPPVVRLESVSADDLPLPLGPTVAVPAGTGRVQLAFTTTALLYPERIRFRFRVEGVDPDWVDIGTRRFASWVPAGPGRRRFMVEARNEDGVWSATPAVVELDVRPAWWQRSAVRFLGLIAIVAAVAGAFRRRLRAVERRHAERVRVLEERRRAAELRTQLEHVARVALAGELATGLAHEVNQPLTAIVSNAQAARRFLTRYLAQPAELEEVLADIAAQGLRASEVVQGLRGFLRGGAGAAARLDLSALVREMLPLVRRELEENHVELELALADGLAPVEGIRVQLGQIVVNLVVNACEALAQVHGPRRLSITTREQEAWVELAVRDSGPGISPEVEARLFQPFVTTKPGGMGMGLAICRSIAENHGGRLSAEAPPDGGVRIILALPAVTAVEVTP